MTAGAGGDDKMPVKGEGPVRETCQKMKPVF